VPSTKRRANLERTHKGGVFRERSVHRASYLFIGGTPNPIIATAVIDDSRSPPDEV
jgi:hypothetical protein